MFRASGRRWVIGRLLKTLGEGEQPPDRVEDTGPQEGAPTHRCRRREATVPPFPRPHKTNLHQRLHDEGVCSGELVEDEFTSRGDVLHHPFDPCGVAGTQ